MRCNAVKNGLLMQWKESSLCFASIFRMESLFTFSISNVAKQCNRMSSFYAMSSFRLWRYAREYFLKRALALGRNVTFLYIRGGFLEWKYYVFILGDLVRVELFRFCL